MSTRTQMKIKKKVLLKIVTSGYDDRFLHSDVSIYVTLYTKSGQTVTCNFNSEDQMIRFLTDVRGFTYANACKLPITTSYSISGYLDSQEHHFQSRIITRYELGLIQDYLTCRNPRGYTFQYIAEKQTYLDHNPMHPDLLAIVQYQLSECDRLNTLRWGNPNGRV